MEGVVPGGGGSPRTGSAEPRGRTSRVPIRDGGGPRGFVAGAHDEKLGVRPKEATTTKARQADAVATAFAPCSGGTPTMRVGAGGCAGRGGALQRRRRL
jgi:hypothetical protein